MYSCSTSTCSLAGSTTRVHAQVASSRVATKGTFAPKLTRTSPAQLSTTRYARNTRHVVRAGEQAESSGSSCGCGKCDGTGRIPGGMTLVASMLNNGKVPDWFPIKAYMPCPNFIAAGNRYEQKGQSVDEIFFGNGTTTQDFLGSKEDLDK
mmetsp:Transcript_24052/g.29121  ORF Transcript_24052/g.29121 Transcript_24052/m.29121 type:complete len:151 (+) Transcript_24052:138-590(+)|eukprot:CAMPEP_0197854404 /NCGR_PEP_ID=MMETSP1438-20131217/24617_1 /TAXON_ID=1461541 /ORGANISM="Pterosperma sp., Strain CCMP1384" /LENGTH=150 /DNA_ID=CAMNT_0043469133 /DNA_START=127 /DNA_END=579 /DNA_ORIENTATION=-